MTMTTQIRACPRFRCIFPQVQIFRCTIQHLPRSPAGSEPVRHVHSLQPIPNQTGLDLWQLQNPQSVPAALGPQEAVQLVTQRAREALHDQRETTRIIRLRGTLDHISTRQDWFMRHNKNIETCLKNVELLIQPPHQKVNDSDRVKQNFNEKSDSKIEPEQDLMFYA